MAAALRLRSAVCSIVVYLLVSLIVCKLAECPLTLPRDERLSKLTTAKTVNTVNIKAVKPHGDKQVSKKARSQIMGSVKLINATKLLNMNIKAVKPHGDKQVSKKARSQIMGKCQSYQCNEIIEYGTSCKPNSPV